MWTNLSQFGCSAIIKFIWWTSAVLMIVWKEKLCDSLPTTLPPIMLEWRKVLSQVLKNLKIFIDKEAQNSYEICSWKLREARFTYTGYSILTGQWANLVRDSGNRVPYKTGRHKSKESARLTALTCTYKTSEVDGIHTMSLHKWYTLVLEL